MGNSHIALCVGMLCAGCVAYMHIAAAMVQEEGWDKADALLWPLWLLRSAVTDACLPFARFLCHTARRAWHIVTGRV